MQSMTRIHRVLITLVSAGIFTLFLCSPATAQADPGIDISVRGMAAFPSGPAIFSDYWKWGFGGGVGFGYPLGQSLRLQMCGDYERYDFDSQRLDKYYNLSGSGSTVSGAATTIMMVTLQLQYPSSPSGILPIYLSAGAGYLHSSVSVGTATYATETRQSAEKSGSCIIITPGLGLEYGVSPTLSIFAEARYYIATSSSNDVHSNHLPLIAGIRTQL